MSLNTRTKTMTMKEVWRDLPLGLRIALIPPLFIAFLSALLSSLPVLFVLVPLTVILGINAAINAALGVFAAAFILGLLGIFSAGRVSAKTGTEGDGEGNLEAFNKSLFHLIAPKEVTERDVREARVNAGMSPSIEVPDLRGRSVLVYDEQLLERYRVPITLAALVLGIGMGVTPLFVSILFVFLAVPPMMGLAVLTVNALRTRHWGKVAVGFIVGAGLAMGSTAPFGIVFSMLVASLFLFARLLDTGYSIMLGERMALVGRGVFDAARRNGQGGEEVKVPDEVMRKLATAWHTRSSKANDAKESHEQTREPERVQVLSRDDSTDYQMRQVQDAWYEEYTRPGSKLTDTTEPIYDAATRAATSEESSVSGVKKAQVALLRARAYEKALSDS